MGPVQVVPPGVPGICSLASTRPRGPAASLERDPVPKEASGGGQGGQGGQRQQGQGTWGQAPPGPTRRRCPARRETQAHRVRGRWPGLALWAFAQTLAAPLLLPKSFHSARLLARETLSFSGSFKSLEVSVVLFLLPFHHVQGSGRGF